MQQSNGEERWRTRSVCLCDQEEEKSHFESSLRQIFMMSGAVLVLTAGDQREPCGMGADSAFSRPVSLVAF